MSDNLDEIEQPDKFSFVEKIFPIYDMKVVGECPKGTTDHWHAVELSETPAKDFLLFDYNFTPFVHIYAGL